MIVFVCGSQFNWLAIRFSKRLKPLVEGDVSRDLAKVSTRGFIPLLNGEICKGLQ